MNYIILFQRKTYYTSTEKKASTVFTLRWKSICLFTDHRYELQVLKRHKMYPKIAKFTIVLSSTAKNSVKSVCIYFGDKKFSVSENTKV